MDRILIITLICLVLAGCNKDTADSSEKRVLKEKAGAARIELFKECMKLAAALNKAETQHYNDLDEVVLECSSQAYHMTNHMR